jgi:hypothetical protein
MGWPFHASTAAAMQWQNTNSEAPAASRAAGSWLDWSEDVAYTILVAMVFLWSALSIDWRTAAPETAVLSSHIAWGVRLLVFPWGVLWVVLLGRSYTERLGGRRTDGPRLRPVRRAALLPWG